MKNCILLFLILMLFTSCKEVEKRKVQEQIIYPNQVSYFAFNEQDTIEYALSVPRKFSFKKTSWDESSCTRAPYEELYLLTEKDSNLINSRHGGWSLEPYMLMPLIDSLYAFDFFSLDKTLYPNNWHNRHSNFNYREIIPRGEPSVFGHGKIRLKNNCQIYYVLYQDYKSSILEVYISSPEYVIKAKYEQFNFINFSKMDSALIAFQTYSIE